MISALIRVLALVCYLTAAIGTPWFAHFCGGEHVEDSPYVAVPGCCSEDSKSSEKDGCCENKTFWVSADDHSGTGQFAIKLFAPLFITPEPIHFPAKLCRLLKQSCTSQPNLWRPPPLATGKIWLLAHKQLLN